MVKMISHSSLGMRTIIFVWVAIFVVSSYTIIEGRHISREEYLEAKRLVKHSRRPTVKIIQDEDGDIFDCVIIDKQLAFEHPALKNHTIRMKPTFVPESKKDEGSNHTSLYMGLKGGGCPVGSVLIRRLQISDILRSTSVSSFGRKDTDEEHHYAVARSFGEHLGAKAKMNTWNPTVLSSQFSNSQLWIVNESPIAPVETIEAGWIAYPKLYHDGRTRLFTFWTIDGYENFCYDLECAGFTQISTSFTVGGRFRRISEYNSRQYYDVFQINKDTLAGDWWLRVNEERIGYWPNNIFNRLSTGRTTKIEWGGETMSEDGLWPDMGSGHFPIENNLYGKSCTFFNMKVYNGGTDWEDVGALELYESNPNCYRIIDGGNQRGYGRHIAFGGPGDSC